MDLTNYIRDIKDFPKEGIVFKDITPLLKDKDAFSYLINLLANRYKDKNINYIAGIDSRGFIFGSALALKLGVGFVPIRKKGKLPYECISEKYELEYGYDEIEIHTDAFSENDNVVLIDDLIATGGTATAAVKLIKKLGANLVESCFLIELSFLDGAKNLKEYCDIYSVIKY